MAAVCINWEYGKAANGYAEMKGLFDTDTWLERPLPADDKMQSDP